MLINVKVNKHFIRWGRPCDTGSCPVVLATKEAIDVAGAAARPVHLTGFGADISKVEPLHFVIDGKAIPAPQSVRDFVELFDRDDTRAAAEPFEFELEV